MIQFNLLPDVKLQYIKAERQKKLVYSISLLASGIAIFIFIVLILNVHVLQKKQLSDVDKKIAANTQTLREIKDIDKILTIQNQLNQLDDLHAKKHITSRMFTFLPQLTPLNAKIGKMQIDFEQNVLIVSGTADTLKTVNQFADTFKYTKYIIGNNTEQSETAFPLVVTENSSRDEKSATYTLNITFKPELFAIDKNVKLVVPQEFVTTRSITERPDIFDGNLGTGTNTQTQEGGQ